MRTNSSDFPTEVDACHQIAGIDYPEACGWECDPDQCDGRSVEPSDAPTPQPTLPPTAAPTDAGPQEADETPAPTATGGSISGCVTLDINNDGVGDEPVAGSTIIIWMNTTNELMFVAQVETDNSGCYYFGGLIPNYYAVTETHPEGLLDVSDSEIYNIPLFAGDDISDLDFINEPTRKIAGKVLDTYGLDIPTGGVPIPGVKINLLGVGPDGLVTSVLGSTISDMNGCYTFDVYPGDYKVEEETPAGYIDVGDSDGGDVNVIDVDVNSGDDLDLYFLDTKNEDTGPGDITDEAGNGATADAGPTDAPTAGPASISGCVSLDTNNDGSGDLPQGWVTIALSTATGELLETTEALDDGCYTFRSVPPGEYVLEEVVPEGFMAVSDKVIDEVVLPGGVDSDGNDFVNGDAPQDSDAQEAPAMDQTASIFGCISADTDGDGVGDIPLTWVIVALIDSASDVALETTEAIDDGCYFFHDVPPGVYNIQELVPDGYVAVDPADDVIGGVVVTAGIDSVGNNFLDAPEGAVSGLSSFSEDGMLIGGCVSADTDGNGVGDQAMTGVKINLYGRKPDAILASATTNSPLGCYGFKGLDAGIYHLHQETPEGYTDLGPNWILDVTVTVEEPLSIGNDFINKPNHQRNLIRHTTTAQADATSRMAHPFVDVRELQQPPPRFRGSRR